MDESPKPFSPILHKADPLPHQVGVVWMGGILEVRPGIQRQIDIRPGVNRYRECSIHEDIFAVPWIDVPPGRIVNTIELDAQSED